jgi:hypothetical protein
VHIFTLYTINILIIMKYYYKTGAEIAQSVKRLGYGLDDRGVVVLSPVGGRNVSLLQNVYTGSRAHSASNTMGTEECFPGGERQGRETDHSTPSSAEIKNAWSYISNPPYVFTAWCLIN